LVSSIAEYRKKSIGDAHVIQKKIKLVILAATMKTSNSRGDTKYCDIFLRY